MHKTTAVGLISGRALAMRDETIPTFRSYHYSDKKMDVVNHAGQSAGLRNQSVAVFHYLAQNSDRVIPRQELEDKVWGNVSVTNDSLTKCIAEIRKAIGDEEKKTLKTLPRRGYQLVSDLVKPANAAVAATDQSKREHLQQKSTPKYPRVWRFPLIAYVPLALVCVSIVAVYRDAEKIPDKDNASIVMAQSVGVPTLSITISDGQETEKQHRLRSLIPELRVALNRYHTVQLVRNTDADLLLLLSESKHDGSFLSELIEQNTDKTLFAEKYENTANNSPDNVATRLAAAVASPGIGAVDSHLLQNSRLLPVDNISPAACYAHGYGCSKCSGEEDNITRRAEDCLDALLEKNPDDARAWALQATIHAHQYWWGNTLPEPMRSDPSLRTDMPEKAIQAATRAEALSDGRDTAVYWGLAEAYYSACESDKLHSAIQRGLEINPYDPNLLGAFGNWLAYSGKWEEGTALTFKALELEPRHYKKWWWMGPAKAAYFIEDFDTAYQYFLKAFNERNWMSHLQLAYTLPHLGRIDDARKSVATLQYMYPGFTREKALEIYKLLCFPDSFLTNINQALELAGLPSRGSSQDFSNITLPRTRVVKVNDIDIEYLDVGKGEPIVFVHGAFNDYRSWGHYMIPVSKNHRYISYSRRYFGTQKWVDNGESFSVDTFAKDLVGLIEALDIGPVHLVTWSSGVRTGIATAVKRPDLIKSLIHFEPVEDNIMTGAPNQKQIAALQAAWGERWGPVGDSLTAGDEEVALQKMFELVFEMESGGYVREREILREVTRQNARSLPVNLTKYDQDSIKLTCEYVSQVQSPTLVVHGETTHEYWRLMSERFAECTPAASLAMIKGSNHYAPIEQIDAFGQMVLSFVDAQ